MSRRTSGTEKLDPHKFGVDVRCTECHMTKAPLGRSVAPVMANGMCDWECPGYAKEPRVGSLWPDESEADFGYPVGAVGTRRIDDAKTKD
jgi:hypothetical protein